MDQPQEEVHGLEETTHAAPTIRGRKRTTEAEQIILDAEKIVGAPTSQRRQRQSPDRYTRYMALMSKCIVTEPSSFEEVVEDPSWVDSMVEEYDSIVRNSAWEIVPRLEGKSVVGSRWIYKVKQAADGSVENYKAILLPGDSHRSRGSTMKKPLHLSQGILPYGLSLLSQRKCNVPNEEE